MNATRRSWIPILVALALLAVAIFLLRRPGSDTLVGDFGGPPKPPLVRPASSTPSEWVGRWRALLPVHATLEQGSTSWFWGTNREYKLHLDLENRTGWVMPLGRDLYLIETSVPKPGEKTPLIVSSGEFRQTPAEDYSGVVEIRQENEYPIGSEMALTMAKVSDDIADDSVGLMNSQTYAPTGVFRHLGAVFSITIGAKQKDDKKSFGTLSPRRHTVIDSELQLAAMVKDDRLGRVYLVTPPFAPAGGKGAPFRYILAFDRSIPAAGPGDKDAGEKKEGKKEKVKWVHAASRLMPMTADVLTATATNPKEELWKRTYAAWWIGKHAKEGVARLVPIVDSKENDALRTASISALGVAGHAAAQPVLMKVAQNEDERIPTRAAAVTALGRVGVRDSAPYLIKLAGDTESLLEDEAIEALGDLGDPAAAPVLLAILEKDSRSDVHYEAGRAIARLGDPAVDGLKVLAAKDKEGSDEAFEALGNIGGAPAAAALAGLYETKSIETKGRVCRAIGKIDLPEANALLTRALGDPEVGVRLAAVSGAAGVSSAAREEMLLRAAADREADVQKSALHQISQKKIARAKDPVLAIGRDAKEEAEVRASAIAAFAAVAGGGSSSALRPLLADPVTEVRIAAMEGLGEAKAKDSAGEIARSLSDPKPEVRAGAARALGKLGDRSQAPALVQALLKEKESQCTGADADALIELEYKETAEVPQLLERFRRSESSDRDPFERLLNHITGKEVSVDWDASRAEIDAAVRVWKGEAKGEGKAAGKAETR